MMRHSRTWVLHRISVVVAGLTLMVSALGASSAAAASDVQVLAIGTNRSFKSSLKELKFAETDAKRFVEAMHTVGLVPSVKATVATDPSVAEFREAFRVAEALSLRDGEAVGRKFVFYFSGHSDDRGLHMRDGMITKAELHQRLTAISAHTKVAILDSCFSGAITAKGVETAPEFELPKVEFDEPSGSVFLSASSGRQLAFESDDLEGSVFTHHLLAGLYGEADGNADGVVTVDELYQHVYRNTKWQSLNYPTASAQEPEYVAKLQGQGAIVLSFPAKTNSQLTLANELQGEITIASPKGIQFFKVDKAGGQVKTIQLPVGPYKVSVRDSNRIGEGSVKVEPARVAFLARSDVRWRLASIEAPRGAKGDASSVASTVQAETPSRSGLGLLLGAHTGYASGGEIGPFAEISYRYAYAQGTRWQGWFGGALSFHRNRLMASSTSEDAVASDEAVQSSQSLPADASHAVAAGVVQSAVYDETLTTDTSAAYAMTGVGFRTPWRAVPLVIGIEAGYGQAYHDQSTERDGVRNATGGYNPGYVLGASLELATASGRRFGIVWRRETMLLRDLEDQNSLSADIVALSAVF